MMIKSQTLLVLCLLGILSSACSIKSMARGYLMETFSEAEKMLKASKNYQVVERAMPALIIMLDSSIASAPDDDEMLLKGAKMHTGYALAFVEHKDPQWAGLHYEQALNYCLRAVELRFGIPQERLRTGKPEDVEKAISVIGQEGIAYLTWLGMSWGSYINTHRDQMTAVGDIPYVRVIMNRVLQWDETYENALPHIFFGAYYGGAVGEEPEKTKALSQKHFERALALTKRDYFLVHVLYARTYAKQFQDRAKFQELLEEVGRRGEGAMPTHPDLVMTNAMAVKQAEDLLDKIDEFFPFAETEEAESKTGT